MKPVIIINFKTYKEGTGKNALKLAKICEKVARKTKSDIRIAVQTADIYRISQKVKIPVYSQHIGAVTYGAFTGHTLPEAIKEAGAKGTLLNHSERRLRLDHLGESVKRAKSLKLCVVICANDPVMGTAVTILKPDFVAVEPPELIGGEVSVSTAKPQVVKNAVKMIHHVYKCEKVLVGAGVKDYKDLKKSIQLGASGVLLSSHIVKAKNPEKALLNLIKG